MSQPLFHPVAGRAQTLRAPLAAIALAALLAACGGGGGADDAEQLAAAPASAPAVEPEAELLEAREGAADAAAAHFNRLNEARRRMGLGDVRWDGALAASAQNHANYLVWNQAMGHEETPGLPGFTGTYIAERAAATGYRGKLVQETKSGGVANRTAEDGRQRMDELLLAPLHRLQLLAPEFDQGASAVAADGGPLITNLGASGGKLRATQRRWMYPYNGQAALPRAFRPGTEVGLPDDLPAVTGTPLTLSGFLFSMISYSSTSLVEEATGQPVPLLAQSQPGQIRASLIFFPTQELKPNTAYVWRITAKVDGVTATTLSRFVTAW